MGGEFPNDTRTKRKIKKETKTDREFQTETRTDGKIKGETTRGGGFQKGGKTDGTSYRPSRPTMYQ